MQKIVPVVAYPGAYKNILAALEDSETSDLVLFSGRDSGKTWNVVDYVIIQTFMEFYNNVLFIRATKSQIDDTIFAACVNAIERLGVAQFFTIKKKGHRIINNATNSTLYFEGIDENPEAIKGFTPTRNKLAMIIFEEFTELSDSRPIEIATETIIRYTGSDSRKGRIKIIMMGNPSRWNNHWSWDYIERAKSNPKCKVFSPKWYHIREILNPFTVEYIENIRDTNPRYYRYAYLGERMSYEGLVYPQFDENCLVDAKWVSDRQPVAVICGLDPASKRDKTAFTISTLFNTGEFCVLDMWCYNPKEFGNEPLSPSQQTERFMDYFSKFFNKPQNFKFRGLPRYIVCDPANGGMDLEIKLNYSKEVAVVNVDKKERLKDIERNTNAMALGRLKILKNVDALKPLLDELSMMVWREKVISKEMKTIKSTQLTIGEDDCHDSMTYALHFALNDARFVQYNSNLFVGR